MAIGGKGRLAAGNWEPSRAGALQLLSGEIRPVPQYGRNPLFVNLVAPAGPVEIRERQPHQQIAEWSRIENASVVDDGEAIHLNSPCKAPDQFSLSPDSLWRASQLALLVRRKLALKARVGVDAAAALAELLSRGVAKDGLGIGDRTPRPSK